MNPTEDYRKAYREVVESTLQHCREYYGERLVSFVLFGSVAKDTFTWESDIDILLVADGLPDGRYKRVMEFQKNVESNLEARLRELFRNGIYAELSPVFKTPAEVHNGSPLFVEMTDSARIIFDRDKFFESYLDDLSRRLRELGARKVPFKGGYYWVLKPGMKPGESLEL